MAVTQASLTGGSDTTDTSSYTTFSITPSANKLILVAVASSAATTPNTPTISGNGLTYVEIANRIADDGLTVKKVTLFRAMGASPSTGVITIDFAGQTQTSCLWSVAEFDGIDTGGTNGSAAIVQSATAASNGTVTSLTVTLAAFADVGNATYGAFTANNNQDQTPGTDFSQIHDVGIGTPGGTIFTEWRADNDTTVDESGATAARRSGIAVEIKAAGAVGFPEALLRKEPGAYLRM